MDQLKDQLERRKHTLIRKRENARSKADVQMAQTALMTFDSVLAIFEQYGDAATKTVVSSVRNP